MSDYSEIFREFANSDTFVISRSLLEEYKQKATDSERERIIKLLENYQGLTGMFGLERDDLIALIKGEK